MTVAALPGLRLRHRRHGRDRRPRRQQRPGRPAGRAGPRRPPTSRSAVGLGVGTGAQAAEVASYADGVIVGSAFVRALLDHPDDRAAGLRALGGADRGPRRTGCAVRSRHLWLLLLAARCCSCRAAPGSRTAPNAIVVGGDDDGFNGAVLTEAVRRPRAAAHRHRRASGTPWPATPTSPLTLVFFGYTHCPDVCQIVMATIASSACTRLDAGRARPGRRGLRDHRPGPRRRGHAARLPRPVRPRLHRAHRRPADDRGGGRRSSASTSPGPGAARAVATRSTTARRSWALRPDGTAPIVWTQGTSSAELAEDIHHLLGEGADVMTAASCP